MNEKATTSSPSTQPAIIAWAVLMLATLLSWWLAAGHGLSDNSKILGASVIIGIAFIKVQVVGMYFMELRHSWWLLRYIFTFWVALTCCIVLGLYVFL